MQALILVGQQLKLKKIEAKKTQQQQPHQPNTLLNTHGSINNDRKLTMHQAKTRHKNT